MVGTFVQCIFAAGHSFCLEAIASDDLIKHGLDGLVIIHDQYGICHKNPPLQIGFLPL